MKILVSENRIKKGRPSRLTEAQIDNLIIQYNSGDTQKELAERFGISISTVRKYIKERKR